MLECLNSVVYKRKKKTDIGEIKKKSFCTYNHNSDIKYSNKAVASLTGGGCCVLPGALDLQEDGVGVISKQQTSKQAKYLGDKKFTGHIT